MSEEITIINLKLEIKRVSDGVIATLNKPEWTWNRFWFEEGNCSCDCNREIYFCEGMGIEEPKEIECGDSRFVIRCSNSDTGEVLHDEFESRCNPKP